MEGEVLRVWAHLSYHPTTQRLLLENTVHLRWHQILCSTTHFLLQSFQVGLDFQNDSVQSVTLRSAYLVPSPASSLMIRCNSTLNGVKSSNLSKVGQYVLQSDAKIDTH